ncbi:MAG: hypothetical protein VX776_05685 [Planctomycetota bacterium]|nr:hypothetical protein [Planctomycetota bacterium]
MTNDRRPGILPILLLAVVVAILGFNLWSSDASSSHSVESDFWLIYH